MGRDDTLMLPLGVGSPLTEGRKPEEGRGIVLELMDNGGKVELGRRVMVELRVELMDSGGKVELGRRVIVELMVELMDNGGNVELGRRVMVELMVELMDSGGKVELGRRVMVEFNDNVGNPEATEVLRFPGIEENPELGRVVKLAFADGSGKPELGAVIVGRRVVVLAEIVGLILGTERLVRLEKVGAMVGRVPDEGKVFERDSVVLGLGKGADGLELREPTMLETGDVTAGAVIKGGVGTTELVDNLVVGAPREPCRVRSSVVVPVVTYT